MIKPLLLLIVAALSASAGEFRVTTPSRILGPNGAEVTTAGGSISLTPASGSPVNVVGSSSPVYLPSSLSFSNVSGAPITSGSGQAALSAFNNQLYLSLNAANPVVLGSVDGTAINPSSTGATGPGPGTFTNVFTGFGASNIGDNGVELYSAATVAWSGSGPSTAGKDLIILRAAPNTLALRDGTGLVPQKFIATNLWSDSLNKEEGVFDWQATSNVLTIGTTKAGTGSSRAVQFVVGGANNLLLNTSGDVVASGSVSATNLSVTGGVNLINGGTAPTAGIYQTGGYLVIRGGVTATAINNAANTTTNFIVLDNGDSIHAGRILFTTDNTSDIGAIGANRPKNINASGNVTASQFIGAGAAISGNFSGTGTATTTFTVTIGTTMTLPYKVAHPCGLNVLSSAICYVTNKTTTTFDVVYLTGLTGAVAFDWEVFP